jgi:uncharacterized protein
MARVSRKLIIETKEGLSIASQVRVAASFWSRAKGLLGRSELASTEGLLFEPGGSVHTVGMRIVIDVAFLDRDYRVLKTSSGLQPFRGALAPRGTRFTLELANRRLEQAGVKAGDQLRVTAIDD